ncbi:hypothetical protein H6503_00115 [Candidatus Woesearchaeota archaeon]|nr:hypothetical protein [Candidatus Woesearchaeota archaeon]
MWVEYVVIVALILILIYILIKYFDLRAKMIETKRELNSQSLDYHLQKIKEAGYDFTLKGTKSSSRKTKQKTSTGTKSKHMSSLIEQ